MAINLVSLVSQFLTPQLVSTLARALGVNEAVAQKVVAAAVPAILASLGTAAAAPGGAQKVSDAISMSDPDILTKLSGAITGGNTRFLNEGATLLSGLLGGGGLSSLAGALSQFSGAPHPATQTLLGTTTQAAVGTIGQQDPSNWSDPSAILSMLNSQKDAISAALPPELSKALGASGLLAGLGGAAAARDPNRSVDGFERRDRRKLGGQFRREERRSRREERSNRRIEGPDAACAEVERLPDVGDHSHRHCRAAGDLVVHDPKSKAGGAGENGPPVGPGRVRLARSTRSSLRAARLNSARHGAGGPVVALAMRAAERSSGAISSRRHLCGRPVGDRGRLLQPPLRHPRRRTERAGRQPGRSPCCDDARARP